MQRGRIAYETDIGSLDQEAMIRHLGIGRLLSAGVVAAGGRGSATAKRNGSGRVRSPRRAKGPR